MPEERRRPFRMSETEDGEIEASLETEDGEACRMRFAPSGRGKFRTIESEGDEGACARLKKRVRHALGGGRR